MTKVVVFLIALVAVVLGGWYSLSRRDRSGGTPHEDPEREARVLRRTAFAAIALSTVVIGLFVVGETLSDPGGWEGVGLVSAWAVPLVVVAVLAWRDPDLGLRLLGALVVVVLVACTWFAVDPHGWRTFEDAHGPVRTIATFALAAALGLLGLRRPAGAGLELIVLAVAAPVISVLGSRAGSPSLIAVATVPMLAGVLYLLSAWVGRGRQPRWGPAR